MIYINSTAHFVVAIIGLKVPALLNNAVSEIHVK